MQEAVTSWLPVFVPFIVAFLGFAIAPAFLTARRLRSELTSDIGLVDQINGVLSEELRLTMGPRMLQLVSITRYPTLTSLDLVSLSGAGFMAALMWWGIWLGATKGDLGSGLAVSLCGFVMSTSSWMSFHLAWALRGRLRHEYLRSLHGRVPLREEVDSVEDINRWKEKASTWAWLALTTGSVLLAVYLDFLPLSLGQGVALTTSLIAFDAGAVVYMARELRRRFEVFSDDIYGAPGSTEQR
jgi:hypothetical protein